MMTRSGKHRPEASLWIWISISILLPSTFSFPVSQLSASDFYHRLYQNGSSCPLLPKVEGEEKENYLSVKINSLCDNPSKTQPPIPVCQSLLDLFPRLCKLSGSDPSAATKVSVSLDLLKVNKEDGGLETFCGRLIKRYENVSRSDPNGWINPFQNGGKTDCDVVCKNGPVIKEKGDEEIDVSPACIVLMEGYRIYQEAQLQPPSSETTNVKAVPDSKVGSEVSASPVEGQEAKAISEDGRKSSSPGAPSQPQQNPEESPKSQSASPSQLAESGSVTHNREGVHDEQAQKESSPKSVVQAPSLLKPDGSEAKNTLTSSKMDNEQKPNPDKKTEVSSASIPSSSPGASIVNAESTPTVKSDLTADPSIAKPGGLEGPLVLSSSSSTTSTSTTPASVDRNNGGELNDDVDIPNPLAADVGGSNMNNPKSSTSAAAIPKENAGKEPGNLPEEKPQEDVKAEGSPPGAETLVKSTPDQKSKGPGSSSAKKVIDDDALADLAADGDDDEYDNTSGEVGLGAAAAVSNNAKPPKLNLDIERGGVDNTKNGGYQPDTSFNKPPTFGFNAGMPYDAGRTTINVSLNEGEDTGFFNYFLFCATLAGVLYLVFHNKKKLIAYVVEGRRPRSRTRRNSANSSYRRLENNFD